MGIRKIFYLFDKNNIFVKKSIYNSLNGNRIQDNKEIEEFSAFPGHHRSNKELVTVIEWSES